MLNRVSEDGVLTDWFRKPHKRFGTTYRLINLIVGLQIVTILLSRGDVFVLGEAYAFGVIWSFAFNAISVLILRYKRPDAPRPWRVPLNLQIRRSRTAARVSSASRSSWSACAVVNLFTKEIATIAGIVFTGAFFAMFVVSERIVDAAARGRRPYAPRSLPARHRNGDRQRDARLPAGRRARSGARLQHAGASRLGARRAGVRGPRRGRRSRCGCSARADTARPGSGDDQMFSDYEQTLFTRVVAIAERHGRKVMLLVAPGTNIFDALAQSAVQLRSSLIVVGESEVMTPERQAHLLGEAWDRTPHDPDLATRLVVLCKDKQVKRFSLGAHVPDLSSADIERIHHLWVDAVKDIGPDLHHRDVVAAALATLEDQLSGEHRQEAVDRLRRQTSHSV